MNKKSIGSYGIIKPIANNGDLESAFFEVQDQSGLSYVARVTNLKPRDTLTKTIASLKWLKPQKNLNLS